VRDGIVRVWMNRNLRNVRCYRQVRRSAIVSIVRTWFTVRARFLAAIVSLALVYALTCSANCVNCVGASGAAATKSQGCGHAASDSGGGSQRQAPAKPDCFGHHDSGFQIVQSDGLSRIQLSATDGSSQLFVGAVGSGVVSVALSFSSDLAPPPDAAISPQRKISILRI